MGLILHPVDVRLGCMTASNSLSWYFRVLTLLLSVSMNPGNTERNLPTISLALQVSVNRISLKESRKWESTASFSKSYENSILQRISGPFLIC